MIVSGAVYNCHAVAVAVLVAFVATAFADGLDVDVENANLDTGVYFVDDSQMTVKVFAFL